MSTLGPTPEPAGGVLEVLSWHQNQELAHDEEPEWHLPAISAAPCNSALQRQMQVMLAAPPLACQQHVKTVAAAHRQQPAVLHNSLTRSCERAHNACTRESHRPCPKAAPASVAVAALLLSRSMNIFSSVSASLRISACCMCSVFLQAPTPRGGAESRTGWLELQLLLLPVPTVTRLDATCTSTPSRYQWHTIGIHLLSLAASVDGFGSHLHRRCCHSRYLPRTKSGSPRTA